MAGFLRPFSQIAPLVAQSHERSQCAIRDPAPLWSSDVHVDSKRAMCLQLSMRSLGPCDLSRRSRASSAPGARDGRLAFARASRARSAWFDRSIGVDASPLVGVLGIARSNAGATAAGSRRGALELERGARSGTSSAALSAELEPAIAAPRRAIRPNAGAARSPGRRPDEAGGTRGVQGTSDPLSPTPAPQRGGHYGLGTRVVLGSILPATVTDDEDPAVYPAGGPDRQWQS
jgi:hypothetical protein